MILVTGGARSGKSRLVVRSLADRQEDVVYIATGVESDDEMARRIADHRRQRPSSWLLIEEPIDLEGALARARDEPAVIVDCLTLWVSNLMETHTDDEIREFSDIACHKAAARRATTIVVSNEVGSGLVPMDPLARRFRDLHGEVNQMWARAADAAYLVVAGRAVALPDEGLIVG
ncbi:MAG: bifunctional adenosylcobinamide kinase/adenosylcobinamide-phosphate guanylyltransferase [Acidimicrobiia bacterium]